VHVWRSAGPARCADSAALVHQTFVSLRLSSLVWSNLAKVSCPSLLLFPPAPSLPLSLPSRLPFLPSPPPSATITRRPPRVVPAREILLGAAPFESHGDELGETQLQGA
jgi:hypothetical protein